MGREVSERREASGEARARVAHAHPETNKGKLDALEALLAAYGAYTQECIDAMVAAHRVDVPIDERQGFFPPSKLTSQLQKCARAQATGIVHGWAKALYATQLRRYITEHRGELTSDERVQLFTIGKRTLTAPRIFKRGAVTQAMIDRYWSWVWDEAITGARPSFGRSGMMLSEMCVAFDAPKSATSLGGFWIAVSCLTAGQRVKIPLAPHPSFAKDAPLAKSVLVGRRRDGRWTFQFTEYVPPPPPPAENAAKVAVDVGLNVLAALSDGRTLGTDHKARFDRLYGKVRAVRANRQRQGLRENSKRLDRMEGHLSGLTKSAVGAVVNCILRLYVGYVFVMEALDLRGCRGQKRFAYRALQENLSRKAPTIQVNPAYTSQECPSCHYVLRGNRSGTRFRCRGCGRISHADHVGAVNLLGRSEDQQVTLQTDVADVRAILRARYRARRGTVPEVGARRRTVRPDAQGPRSRRKLASNLAVG